ncbi:glycosyltransferase family 4 protein [Pseudonocardia sp. GCM10023141]|uniref:glycosyltransferase family 4 protein n=1 Tax=Pseudonocardia sp. GCM10023141 TaxID=3252653 RepID=UPI0036136D3C
MSGVVHVVLTGDVDDPTLPSGGNTYDRRVCSGLAARGLDVREHPLAGEWPRPGSAARVRLAATLARVPSGGVVLIDGLVACGVPEIIAPEAHRLRVVVLVHLPLGEEDPELAAAERATLLAVDTVVATSPWTARRLVHRHGLAADRVQVATPGTDPAPLATGSARGRHLVCIGSLSATKGQDVLVEALAAVADLEWTCDLVGPLRRAPVFVAGLRRRIAQHGLAHRLWITGPQSRERIADTFAGADLLVLPSRVESFGMVVTEALARGIPVLAAAVGGVPETVGSHACGSQDAALLVPPADVPALAAALRRWLLDAALRDDLRRGARSRRGSFPGWEVTAGVLAQVLQQRRPVSC